MSRLCNYCECVNVNGVRCHEKGCRNQDEQIRLVDDGTMDTCFHCDNCGEDFRFTYQPEEAAEDDEFAYDDFVFDCLHELQDDHECETYDDDLWQDNPSDGLPYMMTQDDF